MKWRLALAGGVLALAAAGCSSSPNAASNPLYHPGTTLPAPTLAPNPSLARPYAEKACTELDAVYTQAFHGTRGKFAGEAHGEAEVAEHDAVRAQRLDAARWSVLQQAAQELVTVTKAPGSAPNGTQFALSYIHRVCKGVPITASTTVASHAANHTTADSCREGTLWPDYARSQGVDVAVCDVVPFAFGDPVTFNVREQQAGQSWRFEVGVPRATPGYLVSENHTWAYRNRLVKTISITSVPNGSHRFSRTYLVIVSLRRPVAHAMSVTSKPLIGLTFGSRK